MVGWNRKSIQITLLSPILKSSRRPSLPTISHQSIRMSSSPLPPEPYDLHAITSGPTDTWLQNMYRFKARLKNSRRPLMFELYSRKWCIQVQCNGEAGRPLYIYPSEMKWSAASSLLFFPLKVTPRITHASERRRREWL